MHPFPHQYRVWTQAQPLGDISMGAAGLSTLATAAPAEFAGPGDRWSPETLLVGAVGDCLTLTFRGIAARVGLQWSAIRCHVDGTLDRVDRVTRFTHFDLRVDVEVPEGVDTQRVQEVVERAEATCLITRSLIAESHLHVAVSIAPQATQAA